MFRFHPSRPNFFSGSKRPAGSGQKQQFIPEAKLQQLEEGPLADLQTQDIVQFRNKATKIATLQI
jgi:hypothetical protein